MLSDSINEKKFNINVECIIARTTNQAGNRFCGCRILKENRDYQLYGFMKRLSAKNKSRIVNLEDGDVSESNQNEMSEGLKPEEQTNE